MRELSRALPAGSQVTCGAGHFFGFVGMYLALPEGADIQFSSQFGAVGQTLPLAIGMSVAQAGRPRGPVERKESQREERGPIRRENQARATATA